MAWMSELDQFEAQDLLSPDCNNTRVGSGGYGYSSALAKELGTQGVGIAPKQMWGCSNAQIFSEVSPEFHWEFAVEHDLRWLQRWGLTYYGCCEPLDRKIDVLVRSVDTRSSSVDEIRQLIVNPQSERPITLEAVAGEAVYIGSFKTMSDEDGEMRYLMREKRVFVLKDELNTRPRFYYFYAT